MGTLKHPLIFNEFKYCLLVFFCIYLEGTDGSRHLCCYYVSLPGPCSHNSLSTCRVPVRSSLYCRWTLRVFPVRVLQAMPPTS